MLTLHLIPIRSRRKGPPEEHSEPMSSKPGGGRSTELDPLLGLPSDLMTSGGAVDYRGRPASRSASGGWTAALFLMGVLIPERMVFYGISANLISFLTGPLQESTAGAAAAINAWSGATAMLSLACAFVADSYLGSFRTIVIASLFYIVGLALLTLTATLPSFTMDQTVSPPPRPPLSQVALFYISLYLVAIAHGHKPCLQAFGANQFDEGNPKELIARSTFFNWWYFGTCSGTVVMVAILSYVQDNMGWGLGFGIPCLAMVFSLAVLLLGTRTYRFHCIEEESPFARVGKACLAVARKRLQNRRVAADEEETERLLSDIRHAEEAKGLFRLFPIWATCLIYAVVYAQPSTLFTKQGSTLDRRIGSNFQVPPAALQCFIKVSIVLFIPVYDRIVVPLARKYTKFPSGITMLQRIGIGLLITMISLVIAALVEMRRLRIAREFGLIDQPEAVVPMSLWWLVPQSVLLGITEVFTIIGLQEFFYDQVPSALRSFGISLFLTIMGIGFFISGFLISLINEITRSSGTSWFSNDLNRAHLDYFYWLLAGLIAFDLVLYVHFAKAYVYKEKVDTTVT